MNNYDQADRDYNTPENPSALREALEAIDVADGAESLLDALPGAVRHEFRGLCHALGVSAWDVPASWAPDMARRLQLSNR